LGYGFIPLGCEIIPLGCEIIRLDCESFSPLFFRNSCFFKKKARYLRTEVEDMFIGVYSIQVIPPFSASSAYSSKQRDFWKK